MDAVDSVLRLMKEVNPVPPASAPPFALWQIVLLSAAAGGMAWGIRGQYGHESGAMMAGVLLGFLWCLIFFAGFGPLKMGRIVSMCSLGIAFGGCMTYGQTVGLTHDPELVGNSAALRWGLLGLAVKGAIWWGFLGGFLGIAVSPKGYRPTELLVLMVVAMHLMFLGVFLLNEPFDPQNKLLPWVYFSDHWYWEPLKENLKPRREKWGGLALALTGMGLYVSLVRKDRLTRNLLLWGALAGGLGFPVGQCLQAFHAWNTDLFSGTRLGEWTRYVNWWNGMETVFGALGGAVLGLGLWRNRQDFEESVSDQEAVTIPLPLEWLLLCVYLPLFLMWNFISFPLLDSVADLALPMGLIPIYGIMAGRLWPMVFAPFMVALPIAGKTLRFTAFENDHLAPMAGVLAYIAFPMLVLAAFSVWAHRSVNRPHKPISARYAAMGLLCATWCFFYLNFAFFEYSWPWVEWTIRTPSTIVFLVCAGLLSWAVVRKPVAPTGCDRT